jgi:predicted dehydrogenase
MTAPVRIAILGVGLIGRRHLAIAAEEPDCKVVAAADMAESARSVVEAHGARFYSDHRELLHREQLDGVIIATPNSAHARVGIDCAAAGLSMLVEKPLSDTLDSSRALLSAAENAGVSIAVGHHRRFDPTVEWTKSMVDGGDLGRLTALQFIWALRKHDAYYDTRWRVSRAAGGGPVLINLIHDIDLMRHFGGEIVRVYAELGHGARGLEVEDAIAATVRFASGAVGSLVSSDATPSPWGWEQGSGENPDVPQSGRNCYRLLGTRGALALPRLGLYRHGAEVAGDWRAPIAEESIPYAPRAALRNQLTNFCAVVRGEAAPRVDGHDGFATLAATLAISRSGETGHMVHPESVAASD